MGRSQRYRGLGGAGVVGVLKGRAIAAGLSGGLAVEIEVESAERFSLTTARPSASTYLQSSGCFEFVTQIVHRNVLIMTAASTETEGATDANNATTADDSSGFALRMCRSPVNRAS